ncbi:MAG: TonB-dependent receptor [Siphonobacter sp.]
MKIKLFTFAVSLFLGLTVGFSQNTGSISGRITSFTNEPLESVSVSIIELRKGTLTDETGNYQIKNLNPGSYTIRVQTLGAPEKDIPVDVIAGQNSVVNYQFTQENIHALQEVTITGSTNKFSKKESIYVARLPLKNLENPQVFISVPKELIQEQLAIDLGSISKNIPGSGIPQLANQGRVTFLSRGFQTEPMVRNGVAGFAYSVIDPANLERIEAIKGPSATLFGSNITYYGGLFNRVTKKPFNGFGGEVSYFGGSWNLNRLTVDVNTPVNEDKTMLFRINGATSFERSFQDAGFSRSLSLAPSFSYQITDRLSLLFDVEFGQVKATSPVRFTPYTGSNKTQTIIDMKFPYYRSFSSNDVAYSTQMMNLFAQMNYKLSEHWTSQTVISRARSSIDGYLTGFQGRTDSTLRAQVVVGYTVFMATDMQQNFIGDFHIGSMRNRLVVGLDYYNTDNSFDRVTVYGANINFINPDSDYKLNKATIDASLSTGTVRAESNGSNTYSAYASDVLNISERLLAMLSLRVDRFQNKGTYNISTGVNSGDYGQTALSPKLGLVYQLVKDRVSLFGNYMNGFTNQTGTDADGNTFKPEQANQLEFGLKGDILKHKLVGTISYYDILVKDIVRADPNDVNYNIQDGTQQSKGIELELTANPVAGLNIIAGYAYNDSKYTKADETLQGLRPALSGPPHMLNIWASYRFLAGNLKGFGLGFGANHGDEAYQTNTTTAKVILPAYTLLDATLFYDQPKYRIGFKLNNITSEKTWSGRLAPQNPAQFMGNITLKF